MAEFPCAMCAQNCENDVIQCTNCKNWVHRICVPLSASKFQSWSWSCDNLDFLCRNCCFSNGQFDAAAALSRYVPFPSHTKLVITWFALQMCPSVWLLYIIFGFVSTYACFMLCYAFVTPGHASVRLSVYFFFISAYYVFYKLNTPIHLLRSLFLFFKTTKIRLYVRPSVCSLVV